MRTFAVGQFFCAVTNPFAAASQGMIDGVIDRFEAETGQKCTLVATGGFAPHIVKFCKKDITVNDDLVLEGLRLIYEKNL